MTTMRSEVEVVLSHLLTNSEAGGTVSLDAIGEAVGAMAISMDEIEALLSALEAHGREIVGAKGPGAEANLRLVVAAARALRSTLSRRPTAHEVAAQAGLSLDQTLVALALLRVMQR